MDRNIHYFESHNEYINYIESSNINLPHVSYTNEEDLVRYNEDLNFENCPLTFEFIEDGTFNYTRTYSYSSYYYVSCTFYHYRNGILYNVRTTYNTSNWNVQAGDKIIMEYSSSYGTESGSISAFYSSTYYYYRISMTASCYIYGNLMSITKNGVDSKVIPISNMFRSLFINCTKLLNHPKKPLLLPATSLTSYCYYQMFQGCTGLTKSPELPALTLTDYCYVNMFQNCSSLSEIKAAFVNSNSTALTNWVKGVSTEGIFYKNNLATWNLLGDSGIPSTWKVKRYIVE